MHRDIYSPLVTKNEERSSAEERKSLERIAGLLQLIQIELSGCGACGKKIRDRIETITGIIDDLLGIKGRHEDSHESQPPGTTG